MSRIVNAFTLSLALNKKLHCNLKMVRKLINHGTTQNGIRQASDLTQNQQATLSTTTMASSSTPPTTPVTLATIVVASIEAVEGK